MRVTFDVLKFWRWFRSDKVYCHSCVNRHSLKERGYVVCDITGLRCSNREMSCKYFKQKR